MPRVGQVRRRDSVEREIVEGLRRYGCTVFQHSGPGVPDLTVGYRGKWTPMEVKSEDGRLTVYQVKTLTGVPLVYSLVEALDLVRGLK